MSTLGDLELSWRRLDSGELLVTCRELPDFRVLIPDDAEAVDRMQMALTAYLARRHGVWTDLRPETDTLRFRCLAATT